MNFLIKSVVVFALVVGGSYMAATKVPIVRNKLMSMISPSFAQGELLDQLSTHLQELSTAVVPQVSGSPSPTARTLTTATIAHATKLIAESQELIKNISQGNHEDAGIVQQVVGKIADTLLGSSPSPTPAASVTPCIAK